MSATPPASGGPRTVSLADEDAVKRILVDTLFGLWATINNLTRIRPSRRDRYRVTVFGSARTEPGHWVYGEVKRMAAGLSALGCDIVTGGGKMWRGLVDWARAQMLRPGFELAGAEDMSIPRCVDDADGAVAVIREHHTRWLAARGARP
jgi:predicted Rossmann-fold nucleotide-binding protein